MRTSSAFGCLFRHGFVAAISMAAIASAVRAAGPDKAHLALEAKIGELRAKIDITSHADDYFDPAHRDTIKADVLPMLQERRDLFTQLEAGAAAEVLSSKAPILENMVCLAVYGDQDSIDAINKVAGLHNANAVGGKLGQLWIQWINSSNDEAAQGKLLDQFEALTKTQPKNSEITAVIEKVLTTNAASAEIQSRGSDIIAASSSPEAKHYSALPDQLGKPMDVQGDSLTGPFDSASFKGKVVLVDCWATWCENCIAFLPHLKQVYAEYHRKGLNIVGLDSDLKRPTLDRFLAKNPEMDWPQLYAADGNLIHPLARSYGVAALPYAFMIDKQGNLRSTMAREQMDELVPKLLAEK